LFDGLRYICNTTTAKDDLTSYLPRQRKPNTNPRLLSYINLNIHPPILHSVLRALEIKPQLMAHGPRLRSLPKHQGSLIARSAGEKVSNKTSEEGTIILDELDQRIGIRPWEHGPGTPETPRNTGKQKKIEGRPHKAASRCPSEARQRHASAFANTRHSSSYRLVEKRFAARSARYIRNWYGSSIVKYDVRVGIRKWCAGRVLGRKTIIRNRGGRDHGHLQRRRRRPTT
jgi:hypothetical protein